MRLSIDTKAKVKIGNLSRNGKDRTPETRKADDHGSEWQSVLVPFGILNLDDDELSIYFGQSAETSDFIAQTITIPIRLIYYPPYHSKYNAIERCQLLKTAILSPR